MAQGWSGLGSASGWFAAAIALLSVCILATRLRRIRAETIATLRAEFAESATVVNADRAAQGKHGDAFEAFAGVLDSLTVGIAVVDEEGRLRFVNARLQEATGWSRAELLERRFSDLLPAGLGDWVSEHGEFLKGDGVRQLGEIQLVTSAGDVWTVAARSIPTADFGAESLRLLEFWDVSEQKRLREDLEDAETLVGLGHWRLELEKNEFHWSPGTFRLFGLPVDDQTLCLERAIEQYRPSDRQRIRETIYTAIEKGESFQLEATVDLSDGGEREVEARGRPQFDGEGRVCSYLGTIQDVTERKKQEREMLLLSERMTLATRSAQIGIWEWDGKTDRLNWDPVMFEIYGLSPQKEVLEWRDWADLIEPADRDKVTHAYAAMMAGGRAIDTAFRINRPDGETRKIRSMAKAHSDERGETGRLIGVNWDVTREHAALQDAVEAMERAEKADRAKSAFLAAMSHEIRTPMNGVIGMTEILNETGLTDGQREYVSIIRNSGDTLLALINDILDFSKIEAGRLTLEKHAFNLRTIIEETLELLAPQAQEKGVELVYLIRNEVPTQIAGDETRLRQVLINILGNAIKFTHQGEVYVEVRARGDVPTSGKNGDDHPGGLPVCLEFSIRDTGIGIPQDKQHLLFEGFTQLESSRDYGGTGLGLAISRRLVSLMNGRIGVDSEVGKGSTFTFSIEVETLEQPVSVAGTFSVEKFEGQRVLVVDDNPTNRRIQTLQLEGWGMRVVALGKPSEALMRIAEDDRGFDLAILDMDMPGLNGKQLAERIRDVPERGQLPLILLSSVGDVSDVKGFDAVLLKPVRQANLQKAISCALGGQSSNPTRTPFTPALNKRPAYPSLRILLAEDNRVNQRVTSLMVEKLGYSVDIVDNGKAAVDSLERQPYDIILMDVQMPVLNGCDAARHIHDSFPPDEVPRIIALTANAMEGDREESLAAGMHDYITKPVDVARLRAAIERAAEVVGARRQET